MVGVIVNTRLAIILFVFKSINRLLKILLRETNVLQDNSCYTTALMLNFLFLLNPKPCSHESWNRYKLSLDSIVPVRCIKHRQSFVFESFFINGSTILVHSLNLMLYLTFDLSISYLIFYCRCFWISIK